MPGLDTIALETTQPGRTRRRTWASPELTSHSLLTLTFDRLYVAPRTGDPKSETLAAIDAGAKLDDVFGPLAVVIDLVSVRRLKLDLLTNSLAVEYARSGLGTRRLTLTFATAEAADACFTRVWRRLGDGYALTPYQRDTWPLARGPLAVLAAVLLATAALVAVLSVLEDTASAHASITGSPLGTLLRWLNWKVVCAIGGVAAAGSQVWLYRRLTTPPVALELTRTG